MGRRWLVIFVAVATVFTAAATAAAAAGVAHQTASGVGPVAHGSANFWDGKRCIGVIDTTDSRLTLVHESHWDTDHWDRRPPHEINPDGYPRVWESQGQDFRGCHNNVTYEYTYAIGGRELKGQLKFSLTKPWSGERSHSCKSPSEFYGLSCKLKDAYDSDNYLSVHWNIVQSERQLFQARYPLAAVQIAH
jgi:hypothetical protein